MMPARLCDGIRVRGMLGLRFGPSASSEEVEGPNRYDEKLQIARWKDLPKKTRRSGRINRRVIQRNSSTGTEVWETVP